MPKERITLKKTNDMLPRGLRDFSSGEQQQILEVAKPFKGKYCINFKDKKGYKTSIIPVSLPKHPKIPLNLVVVYGSYAAVEQPEKR